MLHAGNMVLGACAARGNIIEREGLSVWHPCDPILVATMNPEEGGLPATVMDRFPLIGAFGVGAIRLLGSSLLEVMDCCLSHVGSNG